MSVCDAVSYLCSTNHIFLLVLACAYWAIRNYGRQEGKLEEKKKSHSKRRKSKKRVMERSLFKVNAWTESFQQLSDRSEVAIAPWAVSVNMPSSSNRRDNEKSEGVAQPIAFLVGSQPVMLSLLHVCIPHQKLIPTSVFTWQYLCRS